MIGALFNGISGLNSFQGALNTQTNNISNVNTVGYKSDNISFADLLGTSGVRANQIDKNLTQGGIQLTNNSYDMALEGKGYFQLRDNNNQSFYTRAGNFRLASDGTLESPNGYKLQGVQANSINSLSSNDNNIFTSAYTNFLASQTILSNNGTKVETINTKTTDFLSTAVNDGIESIGNNYKTREQKILDVELLANAYRNSLNEYSSNPIEGTASTKQLTTLQYDLSKLNTANDSIEVKINNQTLTTNFDTDRDTTLKTFADGISQINGVRASYDSDTNNLIIEAMIPGEQLQLSDAYILNNGNRTNSLPTINTIEAIKGNGRANTLAIENSLKEAIEIAGGEFLRLNSTVDYNTNTELTLNNLQLNLTNLALSDDPFGNLINENGFLYMQQGENRYIVGKVGAVRFDNDLALEPVGDNFFIPTNQVGDRYLISGETSIIGNSLELSNADIADSLVDLVIYQRAFEASSKSITTSDDFLRTAIDLKR